MPVRRVPIANSKQAYDAEVPKVGSTLTAAAANQVDMGPLLKNLVVHKTIDQEFTVTQRPKFHVEVAPPGAPTGTQYIGQGIHYLPSGTQLYIVDGTLYVDGTSDAVDTGDALTKNLPAFFQDYEEDRCVIRIGSKAWQYAGPGAFTQITTGWTSAPNIGTATLAAGLVYLDDYMFVMDQQGTIYGSTNNDFTDWNPGGGSTIVAERNADRGKAIFRHFDHIGAIGQRTVEFFYDASNAAGSPLSRRTDIFHSVGTPDGNSVATLRDTTCFIGQDDGSNYGIYVVNKFNVTKVSDSLADLCIRTAVTGTNAMHAVMFSAGGKDFYQIFFLHSNSEVTSTKDQLFKSYIFDLNENVLMEWDTSILTKGFMPVSVYGVDGAECRLMNYTGEVFSIPNDTIAQDSDGTDVSTDTIDWLVRTYPLDMGTHLNKFWKNVGINGYHAQDTAGNHIDLDLYWSDNLGYTTTVANKQTERFSTAQRADYSGLGSSRHRVFYLASSTLVRVYLQNFIIDVDMGES